LPEKAGGFTKRSSTEFTPAKAGVVLRALHLNIPYQVRDKLLNSPAVRDEPWVSFP